MPRHAFRRRIPNSTHTTLPSALAARCGGVTPTNILEDSGRVLNPILTLIAIDRKSCKNFGISWSNHRILKLERPPPDFPKLFAPHRVPAWLKYSDGVHGRPLGGHFRGKIHIGPHNFFSVDLKLWNPAKSFLTVLQGPRRSKPNFSILKLSPSTPPLKPLFFRKRRFLTRKESSERGVVRWCIGDGLETMWGTSSLPTSIYPPDGKWPLYEREKCPPPRFTAISGVKEWE